MTTYSVDDFGQTYEIDSPATGITRLSYNWAGQVTLKEDVRGATATHEYDPAGRLDVSIYAGLSIIETIDFGYDANGHRTSADSGDLNETWYYERRGLPITVARDKEWMGERVAEEVEFIYSEDGAIETIRYPTGRRLNYGIDYAGRPVSVSADGPWGGGDFIEYVSDVSYLPFGPVDAVTYPLLGAGTTDKRPHDLRYRMTSQNPGLAEPLRSYTYDLASNLLTADNPTGITDEVYTYDDMGRLATASGAFGGITYDYDSIGNLLTRNAVGGPDPGVMDLFYEGDTSPLVERVETTPEGQGLIIHDVVHDAMGNILDDGVSRYFWDPRPIMRFHKQGGTSAYYRYSDYTADGIMMAKRAYTVDPVVYYAQMAIGASPSGQRLSERLWDMNFDIVGGREMVWLGDRLIATFDINASDPDYIFTDHIGYPLMVMDSSASTTWSAVHEPYGEAMLTGGAVANDPLLRYPGQWKDDPAFVVTDPPQRNLFANGYRWYNPDWGRYTQSDPVGLLGGVNLFSYARQNPLRFVDPFGLYHPGDVIYRCCGSKCDVALVTHDPTPTDDCDSAPVEVLAFGNPDRCESGCTGHAAPATLNGTNDPYAGCPIVGVIPSEDTNLETYEARLRGWRRPWPFGEGDPTWTRFGLGGKQCFDFIAHMTDDPGFTDPGAPWTSRRRPPRCLTIGPAQ